MPTTKVTMREPRATWRVHLQAGLSHNEVGRALETFEIAVGK